MIVEVIKVKKTQFSDPGDHILGGQKRKDMITAWSKKYKLLIQDNNPIN